MISNPTQKNLNKAISLKILLAVQAGEEYGLSHLERCKTLAKTLIDEFRADVVFWVETSRNQIRQDLADEGFEVIQNNWSLAETVRQQKFNKLVIDFHTRLTPSLVQRIRFSKSDLPIVVLDNQGLGCMEADSIILTNVHSEINPDWKVSGKKLYQGADYVVLGSNMYYPSEDQWKNPEGGRPVVLIMMGDIDPELMTERVLSAMKDLEGCHIEVMVPPLYPYPDHLEKIASFMPSSVALHWRNSGLRTLVEQSTIVIASFGLAAYELAHLGIPAILIGHYASQVDDMERFAELGASISLGWGKQLDAEQLFETVNNLLNNPNKLEEMKEKGKNLIDGKGAKRVASAIINTVRLSVSSY